MKENIVLIGMSGAGKTTVGKAISYKLKMSFVDMDDYIEKKSGMKISEIFERYGEEYFRKLENDTAEHFGQAYRGTIISTGGGVVLNPDNMKALKENGVVVYLNRSVESILKTLNAEKRPLLKENPQKLYDMYKARHKLYLKYADICVGCGGQFNDSVENVIDAIKNRMQ